jgi:hypothetical protein
MRPLVASLSGLLLAAACSSAPREIHAPTVVSWQSAEAMILAGEIVELESRKDGTIRLHLADGRHLVTAEAAEGAARAALARCGEKCAAVKVR